MERERFRQIKALLRRRGRRRKNRGQRYTDGTIVEVYFYSVICDRPVVWACDPSHWPPGLRRGRLPSQPVMSRRLRTASVRALIDAVERLANPPADRPALVSVVDGKALPIALHSADRQSGKGRGVGNIARGYKIHAIIDAAGRLLAWRLAPLSRDEKAMAQRLVREIPPCAYLVADAQYDSNRLHAAVSGLGMQLVAPRRRGSDKGLGHRRHEPGRLRSKELLEENASPFSAELLRHRRTIERFFAWLTNSGGGLTGLPPWVRGYRRVHAWVQAKIILTLLRRPGAAHVAA